jgi:PadR family transcriptional regulator, regulatory protein PadR
VAKPTRTTRPLLDVTTCLLKADIRGEQLHGWQIVKETKRTGPTVYGILDRLEDLHWTTGYWEQQNTDENRPRRRYYRLTDDGRSQIRELLEERRPDVLKRLAEPTRQTPGLRLPRGSVAPGGAR